MWCCSPGSPLLSTVHGCTAPSAHGLGATGHRQHPAAFTHGAGETSRFLTNQALEQPPVSSLFLPHKGLRAERRASRQNTEEEEESAHAEHRGGEHWEHAGRTHGAGTVSDPAQPPVTPRCRDPSTGEGAASTNMLIWCNCFRNRTNKEAAEKSMTPGMSTPQPHRPANSTTSNLLCSQVLRHPEGDMSGAGLSTAKPHHPICCSRQGGTPRDQLPVWIFQRG